VEEFEKNIREFPKEVQDALTPLKEVCWSLQISKDYSLPFVQDNPFYLALADLILSFDKKRGKEKAVPSEADNVFKPVLELYMPSVPLIVSDSGAPVPQAPIFLKQMEHFNWEVNGEPLPSPSESRSLKNLRMLMELRNSENFTAFREFLAEITEKAFLNSGKEDFEEGLKKDFALNMLELQYLIIEECKWAEGFIKIFAYISSPSAALTTGEFAGESAHEKNPEYSWRLFFSDMERIYERDNLLQKIRKKLNNG